MVRQDAGRGGFTLIELLVVIAIIGVMASLAIPKFVGVTDTAKEAKIQADLHTIGVAVALYQAEHGIYPRALSDLVDASGNKGYLQSVPQAPEPASYDTARLAQSGEVRCTFKNTTYSSYGTKENG